MRLQTYLNDFLSLIYPKLCLGCDAPLPKGSKYICPACHYNLPKTNSHLSDDNLFKEKFRGIVPVKSVLVYAYFIKDGIMQQVLHDLKYNDNQEIGRMMGRWYGHDLLLSGYADTFDLIVPVPLHPEKLKIRGYNQSFAFGEGLSEVLKVSVKEMLVREKNVSSQTRKDKVHRIQDVEGIFGVIDADTLNARNVLLIDDVLTTGSTLISCAEPLLAAGTSSLSIAVMAGVK